MKLIPKSIVNTEIANQKKKQIDEGLLIARKVDSLRETLASLEKQHSDFIDGMQRELKSQTQPLIDNIASLKLEIENLESKRKELLKPLTKEWEEVNSKQKQIDNTLEQLSKDRLVLAKDQLVLEERLKKEKENSFKINTVKNEISKVLKQEEENKKATEVALKSATDTLANSKEESEERIQAIKERDAKVAVREREVQLLKESLDADNKWIKEEKIRLADQRLTLERGLNRIKNK
jgi:chromosome segregation ATPase